MQYRVPPANAQESANYMETIALREIGSVCHKTSEPNTEGPPTTTPRPVTINLHTPRK